MRSCKIYQYCMSYIYVPSVWVSPNNMINTVVCTSYRGETCPTPKSPEGLQIR